MHYLTVDYFDIETLLYACLAKYFEFKFFRENLSDYEFLFYQILC